MRSLWTGAISFGLVNIPVKLYSGSESHALNLDMLHAKDLSPIRFARVCRHDGKEVPWEDIVKGYEYRKDDYIVLTKDDLDKAAPVRQDTLDIVAFADESEVEPVYFDKPYYLEPGKGAGKVYALLCQALAESGKVAITQYVLRNREHLGCIRAQGDLLVMLQMRFADEIRDTSGLKLPKQTKVTKAEMQLAQQLITQLTKPFDPTEYKDTYKDEVERIIEEKAAGKKPTAAAAPKKAEVKDLMAALKKSLEQGKSSKPAAGKRTADKAANKAPGKTTDKVAVKEAAEPGTRKRGNLYLVHDSSKTRDSGTATAAVKHKNARKKAPAKKAARKRA
ncbi:MAG: Ku protein [Pseudomonadota bacterium]